MVPVFFLFAGNSRYIVHGGSHLPGLPGVRPAGIRVGSHHARVAAGGGHSNVAGRVLRWSVTHTIYHDVGDVQFSGTYIPK